MTGRGALPDRSRVAARPVVLLGLMGVGKTSVGQKVAATLGRPFLDSDVELQARYGATAAEQYHADGPATLHTREARLLHTALGADPPPVVAAAASVVDDPGCRAALTRAYVVWLYAPAPVLAGRLARSTATHRPRFDPDLVAQFQRQYAQRGTRFRQLADLTVDVTHRSSRQTAAVVTAAVRRTP